MTNSFPEAAVAPDSVGTVNFRSQCGQTVTRPPSDSAARRSCPQLGQAKEIRGLGLGIGLPVGDRKVSSHQSSKHYARRKSDTMAIFSPLALRVIDTTHAIAPVVHQFEDDSDDGPRYP